MRTRMERCFASHPNRTNPYARSLLLGELSSDPTPLQAKDIRLVHADAAGFLENEPPASFDGFTLSNILDGADDSNRSKFPRPASRARCPRAWLDHRRRDLLVSWRLHR